MRQKIFHPNTKTLLKAWERINQETAGNLASPEVGEHADLMANLFVLDQIEEQDWVFRNSGLQIETLFGRPLIDHDFGSLWSPIDRSLAHAFLNGVRFAERPGIMRGLGETLTGDTVRLEITLAPLATSQIAPTKLPRLLGLVQLLDPFAQLMQRPIWRQRLTALYPPEPRPRPSKLRLV
jgi:hypothetical protein